MKQHITEEQFWELGGESSIGEKRLLKWMRSKGFQGYEGEGNYYFFLPTIGQMIEFLEEHTTNKIAITKEIIGSSFREMKDYRLWKINDWQASELCDALWETVKEVLENKQKGLELTSP